MFGQLRGILVNGRILDYFPSLHLQSPQQQKQSSSTSSLWFPIRQTVFRLTAGGPLLYILDMTAVITVWQRWPGNNTAVIYSFSHSFPNTSLLCPTNTPLSPHLPFIPGLQLTITCVVDKSIDYLFETKKESTLLQLRLKENKRKTQSHLYDVIIEEQPEAVALDDGDVVSTVGTTAV